MPIGGFESIGELIGSNEGTPFSHDNKREHTKRFLVRVLDRFYANDAYVCSHPALPQPYSVYISPLGEVVDNQALMIKKSAAPQNPDDWATWIVTCLYSTDLGNRQKRSPSSDNQPQLEYPTLHWESETVQKAFPYDLDGQCFQNSARCPYKPAPTVELVRPVLVFTRNQLTFGLSDITQWGYVTNSEVFLGRLAGQARCDPPSAEAMYRGVLGYFKVTWKIKFGAKYPTKIAIKIRQVGDTGFYERITEQQQYEQLDVIDILDEGFMRIETDANSPNKDKPVPILKNARQVTTAQLLDGQGQPLDSPTGDAFSEPYYNRFTVCGEADLRELISQGPAMPLFP